MKNKDYHSAKTVLILGPLSLCDKSNNLENIDLVIFVDGGFKHKSKFEKMDHIIIGDNDSALVEPSTFTHLAPKDKDFTDLELALEYVKANTCPNNIILDGFYGERLDHQLAIFSSLSNFKINNNTKTIIYYKHGTIELINSQKFSFQHNGEFSLMPTTKQRMSISGMAKFKASINEYNPYSGNLISNVANGKVDIISDGVYFLHINEKC